MAHHEMQVRPAGDPSRAREIVQQLVDETPEIAMSESPSGAYELIVTEPDMTWDQARLWVIERVTELDHEAPVYLDLLGMDRVAQEGGQ